MPSAPSLFVAAMAGLGLSRLMARSSTGLGRAEAAAEAAFPATGEKVSVHGRMVHAVTEGSGPDLVILHGASGNTYDYTMGLRCSCLGPFSGDRFRSAWLRLDGARTRLWRRNRQPAQRAPANRPECCGAAAIELDIDPPNHHGAFLFWCGGLGLGA